MPTPAVDAVRPVSRLNPPMLLDSTALGLSQVSIAKPGRLAFLSGQTATPRDGGEVPAGLGEQARVVAGNLAAALAHVAASPHDVVLMRVYVVGATTDRFEEAGRRFARCWAARCPA